MKVARAESSADFDSLAIGDKYFGHISGKLCTKANESQGVRLEDGKIGTVPVGTIVKVPVQKGRIVNFRDVKPGQTFIRQGVSDAESFVILKTTPFGGRRLGNGDGISVLPGDRVELLDGTYTFSGKR